MEAVYGASSLLLTGRKHPIVWISHSLLCPVSVSMGIWVGSDLGVTDKSAMTNREPMTDLLLKS